MRAHLRVAAIALLLCAYVQPHSAFAQAQAGKSQPTAGQLGEIQKDWAGTWVMTEDTTNVLWFLCCEGPGKELPLKPKYRKIRNDFAALPFATPEKTTGNLPHCISPGTPGLMQHPLLFEFVWNPDRVGVVFQDGSYRRFWTDGRGFPDSWVSTFQGFSVAHWEGKTLVVETRGISRRAEMFLSAPLYASPTTKVTERYTVEHGKFKVRQIEAARMLRVKTTIEDPEMFSRPFTFNMDFVQVPISFETGCAANNRDNGDKFDLTPPVDD